MDEAFSKAMIDQIWSARQASTIQKYCYSLRKFFAFQCLFNVNFSLPVNALDVAKYIAYLRVNSSSHSSFKMIVVAIKWVNNFFPGINKFNCPLEDNFLLRLKESALRNVPVKKNQKEPLNGCMIKAIIRTLPENPSLILLRNVLMPALGYALLLRHDELSHLNCLWFSEVASGLKIIIPSSKTDVFRQGKTVFLARYEGSDSVFFILKKYLDCANLKFGQNHFLFTPIENGKVVNRKLSYNVFLNNIKNFMRELGLDPTFFGTHSVRSGAATDLASKVSEFELMLTGRWRDPRSLASYVKVSDSRRFSISRELSLSISQASISQASISIGGASTGEDVSNREGNGGNANETAETFLTKD